MPDKPKRERVVPESPFMDEHCGVVRGPHEFVHLRTFNQPTPASILANNPQPMPHIDVFYCKWCLQYINRPANAQLVRNPVEEPNGRNPLIHFPDHIIGQPSATADAESTDAPSDRGGASGLNLPPN